MEENRLKQGCEVCCTHIYYIVSSSIEDTHCIQKELKNRTHINMKL